MLHKSGIYFLWATVWTTYWYELYYYDDRQLIDYRSSLVEPDGLPFGRTNNDERQELQTK